ncbi:RmlC-like cupin [Aaosphaeria arxii CBS 175.79]|uniref:RmlC-like cupin n=1 Tax=Aaosphaeria arxii CBS 175.79 TaxID=1450172 RepID=A0A6A5XW34_9PLEO|nr:RmlC-like cupin [Aaosphaeria arxii CBS 175.79]KAF2017535.1 RmlC-like cupin [Aaosphaeria arxii CBS 175.79]
MPSTIIQGSRNEESTIAQPTATFTGTVFAESIFKGENVTSANVTFTPCARTHWHTHSGGQVIRVVAGNGWICDKGGEARRIKTGDTIWAAPGTTHWHGADEGSLLSHFVVTVGKTEWHEAVEDGEYSKRAADQ